MQALNLAPSTPTEYRQGFQFGGRSVPAGFSFGEILAKSTHMYYIVQDEDINWGLTSECDTRMAVLAPSQPSYLSRPKDG